MVTRIPVSPSNPKKPLMVPDIASHNQITPVNKPRKIPKMLEEDKPIFFHLLRACSLLKYAVDIKLV